MAIDGFIIEQIAKGTYDLIATLHPVHGVGMGVLVGTGIGWVLGRTSVYVFRRRDRGSN